jgi:hypothetical protein
MTSVTERLAVQAESSAAERGRSLPIGHAFPRCSAAAAARSATCLTFVKRRRLLSGGIGDGFGHSSLVRAQRP